MDSRPIGLFDSGVGGLSVLRELRRMAPAESLAYFADTAWFPYGSRPPAEVRKRSFAAAHTLLQANAKLIVVACNTASAAALDDLRQAFDVPFVGMVPGLKPAAQRSQSKRVAILATPGTLGGGLYHQVAEDFGYGVQLEEVQGHGLAEAVERGDAEAPSTHELLRELLQPALQRGADTLVLGCTHYSFLSDAIRAEFPSLQLVDTSGAVARRALQVLGERDELAAGEAHPEFSLIVSGDRASFLRQARILDPEFALEAVT